MPRFELAYNLQVSARQVDVDDPASVVLYGETSAPVDLRNGSDVAVAVTVTAVETFGAPVFLDVYLLGSNNIWSWPTVGVEGSIKTLFSPSTIGTYSAVVEDVATRYVRLLYHLNKWDDGSGAPVALGTYFTLDASLRNGPEVVE